MGIIYVFFLLFATFLFVGIKLVGYIKQQESKSFISLSDITVVIPFKNEVENLPKLIDSLKKQEKSPFAFIFINDHSSDSSELLIQAYQKNNPTVEIYSLPEGKTGKKQALNLGIQFVKTRLVLTLDADVIVNDDYFQSIEKLTTNTLILLPVVPRSKSLLGQFFGTEYLFFNAFNYLYSTVYPISASGANLLMDITKFNYEEQLKQHKNLASGDDHFLLKYLRDKNQSISTKNEYSYSVDTNSPKTFKAYFNQRIRWFSKSKHQLNGVEFFIGLFSTIYFLGGFITLIFAVIGLDWNLFLMIFILRLFLDSLIFLNYTQPLRQSKLIIFLPLFQLIYPLLMIGVLLGGMVYKPKWK